MSHISSVSKLKGCWLNNYSVMLGTDTAIFIPYYLSLQELSWSSTRSSGPFH